MKKELKDFIHLYLGCGIFCPNPHDDESEHLKGFLTGIHGEYGAEIAIIDGHHTEEEPHYEEFKKVKLILRKLDSMTEEEEIEMNATQEDVKLDGYPEILLRADTGETFAWLCKHGFDLFGLIDAGLAIDSATLKP